MIERIKEEVESERFGRVGRLTLILVIILVVFWVLIRGMGVKLSGE